ncbi:MAG: uroporphyrinogen decarboxylase [Caulobacter vibrioides]|uniref:Uroporphyrinogen decarboxylase n=1 Tax=Caulobacter vibrioides TaxID=155892 RepID=A0A258D2A8_CAUVI|nr:MAG: uroporphyrinogen decarboxylase [Caulobacter vibrioides]
MTSSSPIPKQTPKFLSALQGQSHTNPPVWFMRQAGRYLPEYRAVRATAPDFISFCFDSGKAAEVTLQPMRRFPFDASIVFADILLIPGALGQKVWFEAGEGPKLGDMPSVESMAEKAGEAGKALSLVGETLTRVRAALDPDKALIGFAGAPWTVATYMIEKGSSDRIESWAEGLSEPLFDRLVTQPHIRIIEGLRARGVTVPIIGFPRGAGTLVEDYAARTPVQGVALDTSASAKLGQTIQKTKTIQGALDPLLLRAGGDALLKRVDEMLEQWNQGPYIFNLGHGILPDTPIANVEAVLERVTGQKVAK